MKKFSLFLAFVFTMTSSAYGAPAENKDISKVPIKHFLLSYDDLAKLNEKERTSYLLAMAMLLNVREISQGHFIGKIDYSTRKPAGEEKSTKPAAEEALDSGTTSKIQFFFTNLISQANAAIPIIPLLVAGGRAIMSIPVMGSALRAVGSFSMGTLRFGKNLILHPIDSIKGLKEAPGVTNVRAWWASRAVASEAKVAEKLAGKLGLAGAEGGQQMLLIQRQMSAIKEIRTALKTAKPSELEDLNRRLKMGLSGLERRINIATQDPATKEALKKMLDGPLWRRILENHKGIIGTTAVIGTLEYHNELLELSSEAGGMAAETYHAAGESFTESLDSARAWVSEKIAPPQRGSDKSDKKVAAAGAAALNPAASAGGGTDQAPAAATVAPSPAVAPEPSAPAASAVATVPQDTDRKPMESTWVPTTDRGCIFGLRASTWVDFGTGTPWCTRPKDEKSAAKCGNDGYLCPNFGLSADGVTNEILFCTKLDPLANLSVRCQDKIETAISERKLKITKENYEKFVQEVTFKGEAGNLSLADYCKGASRKQGSECAALMKIGEIIKSSAAIERPILAAAANAPASATNPKPAGATH